VQAVVEGTVHPATTYDVDLPSPEEAMDLEEYGHDQIRDHIARKFRGHELTRLVDNILIAQGYHTHRSPAGPDGGVDIIAGRGTMGFDPPHLVVQVKSGDSPVDINVLRELLGVMGNFGANQGLLVSWGGFRQNVLAQARQHFFEIRLWDAGDVVKHLLENYEGLDETLLAELPLKRIWVLVPEE
jgi:restriction system protein